MESIIMFFINLENTFKNIEIEINERYSTKIVVEQDKISQPRKNINQSKKNTNSESQSSTYKNPERKQDKTGQPKKVQTSNNMKNPIEKIEESMPSSICDTQYAEFCGKQGEQNTEITEEPFSN